MQTVSALSSTPSIREVLNVLAQSSERRESDAPLPRPPTFSLRSEPTDLAAWIATDALAMSLYKRYLDARAHALQALLTYGKSCAFSQTAADMSESTWCTLQARLYELRADRTAAARAAAMRALSDQAEQDARLMRQQRHAEAQAHSLSDRAESSQREKLRQTWVAFLLFWYWCRYGIGALSPPCPMTSSLCGAFAAA